MGNFVSKPLGLAILLAVIFSISLACGGGASGTIIEVPTEESVTISGKADFESVQSKAKLADKSSKKVTFINLETAEETVAALDENDNYTVSLTPGNYEVIAISGDQSLKSILLESGLDLTQENTVDLDIESTASAAYADVAIDELESDSTGSISFSERLSVISENFNSMQDSLKNATDVITNSEKDKSERSAALTSMAFMEIIREQVRGNNESALSFATGETYDIEAIKVITENEARFEEFSIKAIEVASSTINDDSVKVYIPSQSGDIEISTKDIHDETFTLEDQIKFIPTIDIIENVGKNTNIPPVAHAGEDLIVNTNDLVYLSADQSFDYETESTDLTFEWEIISNTNVELYEPTNESTVHFYTSSDVEAITLKLTVTDENGEKATDTVVITTSATSVNHRPILSAQNDRLWHAYSEQVTMKADLTDIDDDNHTFSWKQIRGRIIPITSSTTVPELSFTAPDEDGKFVFEMFANDGEVDSAPIVFEVTIAAPNNPPVANLGADITAHLGQTITLDASESYDDDANDSLLYSWFLYGLNEDNILVSTENSTSSSYTYRVPSIPGSIEATVHVTDVENEFEKDSSYDDITIFVKDFQPEAHAGADIDSDNISVIKAYETAYFTLDGSQSFDAEGNVLSYNWEVLSGTGILLDDTSETTVLVSSAQGNTIVSLTVNDGTQDSDADEVTLTHLNRSPIAIPESSKILENTDTSIDLDLSSSFDSDRDELSFKWYQVNTDGSETELTETSSVLTITTPSTSSEVTYKVIVSDEYGASSTISIIVESQNSLSYTSLDLHLPEHIISKEAESVKLNASSTSYYLDGYTGDIGDISYQWYQLQGTPVSLSNSTNDIASFTTPSYSTYSENLIFLVALSSDNLISYKKVEVEVMESSTEDFTLSSSDFSNFGDIPTNISSPQFNLDNVLNEAQEILIVIKDESYDYIYGAMWDIPASTLSIEQDSTDYSLMASSNLSNYDNGEKTYSFTAYTLDTDLTLTNADFSDEDSLETALGSNVISKSTLYGHLSQ